MARPMTVSEAQDQLLETAFEVYRMIYRLHRHREGLRVPDEIEHACYGEGIGNEPPTLDLAVGKEIGTSIDELLEIADRLQNAARATDVSIRRQWRRQQKRRQR